MIRKAALFAIGALLLTTSPAIGGPRPALSDGFVASGTAGSQAIVRLTRAMPMPDRPDHTRAVTLTASKGAFAGYMLQSTAQRGASAYRVQTTPDWTCGRASCENAKPAYGLVWATKAPWDTLPTGDYVLVLLGEPGARVTVTLPPVAKNGRTTRVTMTHTATPHVARTSDIAPGHGADAVALGTYAPPDTHGRAVVGVVHTVEARSNVDVEMTVGLTGWEGRCYGSWLSTTRTASDEPSLLDPVYRTTALVSVEDRPGERCATWNGRISHAVGTQRGLGFSVPLVLP